MKPVDFVTITEISPLYSKTELANKVELVTLVELGFELVAQKGLYQKGDIAVYIQPDYCLSNIPLFDSFIKPGGEEKNSMLGKVDGVPRRIRAKRFNLHKGDNKVIYSNGILLPIKEVRAYLYPSFDKNLNELDLTNILGITKYEESEETSSTVQGKSGLPFGIYKTDEPNILNCINQLTFPMRLIGTEKIDGSSITIGYEDTASTGFICSRKVTKTIYKDVVVGMRKKTFWERVFFWNPVDLVLYDTVVDTQDAFVKNGFPYLEKLRDNNLFLVLRGELSGGKLKGSGNKLNPALKDPPNIKFFGIDEFTSEGIAKKLSDTEFRTIANTLELPLVKKVFDRTFNSLAELLTTCENYFQTNCIEGIVVRTADSVFSAKIMNLEYDSKK